MCQEHSKEKLKSLSGWYRAAGDSGKSEPGAEYRVPHTGLGKDFGFYSQCNAKPLDNRDQA